jgi:ATP adenylyltransferase/5',5'''-P-1,P-4-tetraphosphate phosphorylase II
VSPILSSSGDSLRDSGTLRFKMKLKTPSYNKLPETDFIITGSRSGLVKTGTPSSIPSAQHSHIQTTESKFTSFEQQTSITRRKTVSDFNLQPITTKSFDTGVIPAKSEIRYSSSELKNYLKHMNKRPFK